MIEIKSLAIYTIERLHVYCINKDGSVSRKNNKRKIQISWKKGEYVHDGVKYILFIDVRGYHSLLKEEEITSFLIGEHPMPELLKGTTIEYKKPLYRSSDKSKSNVNIITGVEIYQSINCVYYDEATNIVSYDLNGTFIAASDRVKTREGVSLCGESLMRNIGNVTYNKERRVYYIKDDNGYIVHPSISSGLVYTDNPDFAIRVVASDAGGNHYIMSSINNIAHSLVSSDLHLLKNIHVEVLRNGVTSVDEPLSTAIKNIVTYNLLTMALQRSTIGWGDPKAITNSVHGEYTINRIMNYELLEQRKNYMVICVGGNVEKSADYDIVGTIRISFSARRVTLLAFGNQTDVDLFLLTNNSDSLKSTVFYVSEIAYYRKNNV